MSSDLFLITAIPIPVFSSGNYYAGMDCLLNLMARQGLKVYHLAQEGPLAGQKGLTSPDAVVLLGTTPSGGIGDAPTAMWSGD